MQQQPYLELFQNLKPKVTLLFQVEIPRALFYDGHLLGRFPLDRQGVSAKIEVSKEILTTQKYVERLKEETSNNVVAKLTPRKFKL